MSDGMRISTVLGMLALLSGCGGAGGGTTNGGSSAGNPAPVNQSPGGIWTTQYTVTSGTNAGDTIKGLAIVTETGNFYFASRNQNNGCASVGFGQAAVTGNAISGNVDAAIVTYATVPGVNTSCTYPDGSTSGTGTLSGTINQRSSMTITDSAKTSLGMALGSDTETWTFSSLYNTGSSLSSVAGNYTDGGDTLSINGNGVVFEQDPTTGCVINGQIGVENAQYDAYSLSVTISSCTGSAAAANGLTLTGLAALDTTVSPTQLEFGISASVNGKTVVIADSIAKQ